jgi:protein O-GlcNAc transferase
VLLPSANVAENLAAYAQMDLAVDTTPYCGTTTTCEALVMGVPVVTFCPPDGPHAARVGASLLRAAGLGELVAETPERFAAIIAELDRDRGRLSALRAGLRERVLRSSLCDARGFAARWQDAIEVAWQATSNR